MEVTDKPTWETPMMNPFHVVTHIDFGLGDAAGVHAPEAVSPDYLTGDGKLTSRTMVSYDGSTAFSLTKNAPNIEEYRHWQPEEPLHLVVAAPVFPQNFVDAIAECGQFEKISLVRYEPYSPKRYVMDGIEQYRWILFRSSTG